MIYQHENINRAGSLCQSAKDHGAKFLSVRKTDPRRGCGLHKTLACILCMVLNTWILSFKNKITVFSKSFGYYNIIV